MTQQRLINDSYMRQDQYDITVIDKRQGHATLAFLKVNTVIWDPPPIHTPMSIAGEGGHTERCHACTSCHCSPLSPSYSPPPTQPGDDYSEQLPHQVDQLGKGQEGRPDVESERTTNVRHELGGLISITETYILVLGQRLITCIAELVY